MSARRSVREESFDSIHSSEISNDTSGDESSTADEMDLESTAPKLMTVSDVHRVIHPLRATADRVGRQVEQFAETLDMLAPRNEADANDVGRVLSLVHGYEEIAIETTNTLMKRHDPERLERLKGSWRRKLRRASRTPPRSRSRQSSREGIGSTTVEDLQNWEQERQTWKLLRLLLQAQQPNRDRNSGWQNQQTRYQRPAGGQRIHQYSSELEVWNAFLGDFDDVWEKHVVVEWLKETANGTGQDIAAVIEQLEEGADRGSGLLAPGWLYSKEAIKGQKRLRSWPKPLEPGSPGIDTSLVSKDQNKRLVTQLDPDAFSRQDRDLEPEDVYFERATWLACWEFLRRGQSWDKIRDFCQERVEGWRALSIRGDPRIPREAESNRDAVQGTKSRSLWRKMCLRAAEDGGIDDYENAVYGLLSGDFASMEKVVRNWDDYLFALYDSQLLSQFDFFIQKKFSSRLPVSIDPRTQQMFLNETRPANMSGEDAWQALLSYEKTKEEARQPMKMLQGSLIAGSFEQYIREQRVAFEPDNYDLLRILTHMVLLYYELETIPRGDPSTESIVRDYVEFLGEAGKQDLLPLYASRLSPAGAASCMASQLPKIVDSGERQRIMRLMLQYDMDPVQILRQQLIELAQKAETDENIPDFPKLDMLDFPQRGSYEIPKIKRSFLGDDLTDKQLDVIHGVEWYLLLDQQWPETMWAGVMAHTFFLRTGAFAAAKELTRRVSFSFVSLEKTRSMFGRKMDLAVEQLEDEHPNAEFYNDVLLTSSDTFRGLENMIFAWEALENWKDVADQLEDQDDPRHARAWKTRLQDAHDMVVSTVEQLMQNWLQRPADDEEGHNLEIIRTTYLPDIILGYISVLHFDGFHLSRDNFPKIMNLAVEIAGPGDSRSSSDNAGVTEVCATFQKAGRMAQLVDALTASSLSIMRADQMSAGKKGKGTGGKRKKSGPGGENLDIWNVKVPKV